MQAGQVKKNHDDKIKEDKELRWEAELPSYPG